MLIESISIASKPGQECTRVVEGFIKRPNRSQTNLFSKERNNSRLDWLAGQLPIGILGYESRSDLNFMANLEDTL